MFKYIYTVLAKLNLVSLEIWNTKNVNTETKLKIIQFIFIQLSFSIILIENVKKKIKIN